MKDPLLKIGVISCLGELVEKCDKNKDAFVKADYKNVEGFVSSRTQALLDAEKEIARIYAGGEVKFSRPETQLAAPPMEHSAVVEAAAGRLPNDGKDDCL